VRAVSAWPTSSALGRDGIEEAQCPLLAHSGHFATKFQCPLLGVKRTSAEGECMCAFDPKRTPPSSIVAPREPIFTAALANCYIYLGWSRFAPQVFHGNSPPWEQPSRQFILLHDERGVRDGVTLSAAPNRERKQLGRNVRLTFKSRHSSARLARPLCAKSRAREGAQFVQYHQ